MQSEKMVVIKGTDCNYWLLTHDLMEKQYRAFRIDANGVNHTPVVSNAGVPNIEPHPFYPGPYICGELKVSPDHNKIVMVGTGSPFIELSDFNTTTGVVSNGRAIDSIGNSALYGVEFSPDNNKLYITNLMPTHVDGLVQYNLSLLPDITAVRLSKTDLGAGTYNGMRTGPDGKIYVAQMTGTAIGCIQNPNTLGTACKFSANEVIYPTTTGLKSGGFGANIVIVSQDTVVFANTISSCDSTVTLNMPEGYQSPVWQDGSTKTLFTTSVNGRFRCLTRKDCSIRIDSFIVQLAGFSTDLGKDTAICKGDILEVKMNIPGAIYNWSNGDTVSSLTIKEPGKYYLTVSKNGCKQSDTINVASRRFQFLLGKDTAICLGKTLELTTSLQGSYLWQDYSADRKFIVTVPGTYWLTVKEGNCTSSDTIAVAYEECDCIPGIPNAFTPNNDGLNDFFGPFIKCRTVNYSLSIYNRWGLCVFSSNQQARKWDGSQFGQPLEVGTYFYLLTYAEPNGTPHSHKGDVILIR
jgi:gliding motility-associated-like protein